MADHDVRRHRACSCAHRFSNRKGRSMRTVATVFLLVSVVAVAACDQKLSTMAVPRPNLQPTFSSIQSNIFETTDVAGRQSCVSCHTNVGKHRSGGLNLSNDLAYI